MVCSTDEDEEFLNPTILHEVQIRIRDNDHCERLFKDAKEYNDLTKEVLICASGDIEGGKDSCQVRVYLRKVLNDSYLL